MASNISPALTPHHAAAIGTSAISPSTKEETVYQDKNKNDKTRQAGALPRNDSMSTVALVLRRAMSLGLPLCMVNGVQAGDGTQQDRSGANTWPLSAGNPMVVFATSFIAGIVINRVISHLRRSEQSQPREAAPKPEEGKRHTLVQKTAAPHRYTAAMLKDGLEKRTASVSQSPQGSVTVLLSEITETPLQTLMQARETLLHSPSARIKESGYGAYLHLKAPKKFVDDIFPSARQLKAIAHADAVPSENANQVHARILNGSRLVLPECTSSEYCLADPPESSLSFAHALVLAAQFHNRWVAHLGFEDPMIRFDYLDDSTDSNAAFGPQNKRMDGHVQISSTSSVDSSSLAHESLHVPQQWWADPENRYENLTGADLTDLSALPRSNMLNLARVLPRDGKRKPIGPRNQLAYFTHPLELQAFIEEFAVIRLSRYKENRAPAFEASGLGVIGKLLNEAGKKLNSAPEKTGIAWLFSLLDQQTLRIRFDRRDHLFSSENHDADTPSFGASTEQILILVDRFNSAMHSKGWTDHYTNQVKDRMDQLIGALQPEQGKHLNGEQMLAAISNALQSAWDNICAAGGDALRHPAGHDPSEEEFAEGKEMAWRLFETVAAKVAKSHGRPALTEQHGTLPGLLADKRESGFFDAVAALRQKIRVNAPIGQEDISNAVMRLAGRLCGLEIKEIPDRLLPEIHLYHAISRKIPHVPGLTDGPHQKRKAVFNPDVWLLNIPAQLLRDDNELENILSGLAVNIATEMARLMNVNRTAGYIDGPFRPFTMLQDRLRTALHESGAQALSEKFIEHHPQSTASALRDFVDLFSEDTINRLWHEAARPDIKAKAKENEENGIADADNAARAAYRAGVWKEWNHPLLALRRAVVAATWGHEVAQRVSMLSPQAMRLAQFASANDDGMGLMDAVDALTRQEPSSSGVSVQRTEDEQFTALTALAQACEELLNAGLVISDGDDSNVLTWANDETKQAVRAAFNSGFPVVG